MQNFEKAAAVALMAIVALDSVMGAINIAGHAVALAMKMLGVA